MPPTKTKLTPEAKEQLTRRHAAIRAEREEILAQLVASDYTDPPVERTASNCNTNLQLTLFGGFLLFVVLWSQFNQLPPPPPEVGTSFLAKNRYKPGVRQTASGLQYKILQSGFGAKPSLRSKVRVNYEGRLLSGQVFDSSFDRGSPISFEVAKVVKGWTEGLQLMNEGAEFELYLPATLGYGDQYRGKFIYPHAVLIFKVTLIEVQTNPK